MSVIFYKRIFLVKSPCLVQIENGGGKTRNSVDEKIWWTKQLQKANSTAGLKYPRTGINDFLGLNSECPLQKSNNRILEIETFSESFQKFIDNR